MKSHEIQKYPQVVLIHPILITITIRDIGICVCFDRMSVIVCAKVVLGTAPITAIPAKVAAARRVGGAFASPMSWV
jgi:hypothetical protein